MRDQLERVSSAAAFESLKQILVEAGAERAQSALEKGLAGAGEASSIELRLSFARLGREAETKELEISEAVRGLDGMSGSDFFSVDVVCRMAFVLGLALIVDDAALPKTVTTLYRTGSDGEQASVLRTLSWLPAPDRFVGLSREACRTNDVRVFSALAADNPFPALHMPDEALFQLVLKAMFLGVDTRKMIGLDDRVNEELIRMVRDFAAERSAAGRSIPQDAHILLERADA